MKKIFTPFVFILLFIFLSACTKKKEHYITDQRLRNALNLQDSSYLVYKDSASGVVDTVVVEAHTHSIYEDRAQGTGDYEFIHVHFRSNNDWLLHGFICGQYSPWMNTIIAMIKGVYCRVLVLPFNATETAKWHDGVLHTNVAYHESLQVQNKHYFHVYETTATSDGFYFRSYMSLESGIVQYSIKKDNEYKTFYLIDAKIIH